MSSTDVGDPDGALGFSRNEISKAAISASRSLNTSCSLMISDSRLATERSLDPGREIERLGRGLAKGALLECEFDGECELLVEKEALRERADDNSCESESDCESDLEWSDSAEAACLKKGRLPGRAG